MTLTITITMGNDAMQTIEDLSAALRKVAREVDELDMIEAGSEILSGRIRDANANSVGEWNITGKA
jgi:hypothetical protein